MFSSVVSRKSAGPDLSSMGVGVLGTLDSCISSGTGYIKSEESSITVEGEKVSVEFKSYTSYIF
jgi:hypothetical protein